MSGSTSAVKTRSANGLAGGATTVLLLASMAAIGQFASNIYAPSLPAVASALSIDTAQAQLTFVAFLIAFAIAQLIWGPISDAVGRRPVFMVGIGIFLTGTVGCALSTSWEALMIWRVVQATGAASAIVISRAVTRDSFDGPELAKMLAAVTIAFALVPGLTPFLGGIVQTLFDWRATFWVTAVVGLAVFTVTLFALPETAPTRSHPFSITASLRSYRAIWRDPVFRAYSLMGGFVFAAMSAFFAASPALFIENLGVDPLEYGLYPPLAVSGFMIGGLTTRRLVGKVAPHRIAGIGLCIMLCASFIMLVFPSVGIVHKHIYNASMVVTVTGLGIFLPTAIATALQRFPHSAGAAASLQGFFQMGIGACGALCAGLVQTSLPLLAVPLIMFLSVTLAGSIFILSRSTLREK